MKKLKRLCIGLFGLSFSLGAMDSVIELDAVSSVDYSIAPRLLSETSVKRCIDVLVSDREHSAMLNLLESPGMEGLYGEMVKDALINEHQVVLCEQFRDELAVTELEYYKKREPREGLSERDCSCEGVVAGVLTSNDGIVFLSFRKEGQEYCTYLDFWFLKDMLNDKTVEKKPRCQIRVPVRSIREENFPAVCMLGEHFTNRFIIGIDDDSECQLWCLKEKEEFEYGLAIEVEGRYSYPPVPYNLEQFFQGIYFSLSIDTISILENSDKIYERQNPDHFTCYSSSAWCFKKGVIARWDSSSSMIEYRNADAISQINACFRLDMTAYGPLSSLRLSANSRYLLASSQTKACLIDTISKKVGEIASSDFDENEYMQTDEGLSRSTILKVYDRDRLEMSADERFAVLNWRDKNPILYDLKRKIGVEINIGGKEALLRQDLDIFSETETRSTYLTSRNDMMLSRLGRRIKVVDLKSVLKSKRLRELVSKVKKENAVNLK